MTFSLPDVNVWLALTAEGHVHHLRAKAWFDSQPDASVAFCRVTQMGLLRLLTNPAVMGRRPRSIPQAWDAYSRLRDDRRIVFSVEEVGIEVAWRQLMATPDIGPSSWTDAYLAAFAVTKSYSVVTFDAGFARWTSLNVVLLSATVTPSKS